jgi:hypothetical protein
VQAVWPTSISNTVRFPTFAVTAEVKEVTLTCGDAGPPVRFKPREYWVITSGTV